MEARHVLTQMLVLMTCCLVTSLATRTSSSLQDDNENPESYYSPDMDLERETNQEDISKLLLKHLRFRQLPESGLPMTSAAFGASSAMHDGEMHKRKEQRRLVSNLAALLSGLRDRQAESNMRMPSLRFGK
ncbi:hypothetical protein ACOMHN_065863 [Nucella lapillus]